MVNDNTRHLLNPFSAEGRLDSSPISFLDYYLESADAGQRFDFDEFVSRVAEREGMDPDSDDDRPDAVFHARAIVSLIADIVPGSEVEQVREQLPADEDWDQLFDLVGKEEEAFGQQD